MAAATGRPRERVAVSSRWSPRTLRELTAIIVEPLGAGGRRNEVPRRPRRWRRSLLSARRYDLLLILDEIATGFGRTGTLFACEQAGVVPDLMTLSKALTGGTLPFAATIASTQVYVRVLERRSRARVDARADVLGQSARLRSRERVARFVRA